ncbi:hypothetical protein N9B82_02625 [Saprospiraceae bacterium]|nr:hypothetical protein [Saprospiraceae bacterium]
MKYINEIAKPFFKKMGNLPSSFNEIIKLDNNDLTNRLNPVGAIQRKMIIQYQVDKEIYEKEYEKYVKGYIAYYKDGMDDDAKKYLNLTKKLRSILLEKG